MTDFKVGDRVRLTGMDWVSVVGRGAEHKEYRVTGYKLYSDSPEQGAVPIVEEPDGRTFYLFKDDVYDFSATLVEPAEDAVSPGHYKFGKSEVTDITRHLSFPLGNVVKYVTRAGRKGKAKEDLMEARKYLDWAIEDCDD